MPDWKPIGGMGAAACSWGAGRLDLFERTSAGTLRHRAWVDGGLVSDDDLGGMLASAPTVVAWAVDQAEVFAVFPDGALWNRYWDGSAWHAWESLGGELDPGRSPHAPPGARTGWTSSPAASTAPTSKFGRRTAPAGSTGSASQRDPQR